eukprot:gene9420-17135_t
MASAVQTFDMMHRALRRTPSLSFARSCCAAADAMPLPGKDGQPKVYTGKIQNIVNEISKLTLGEVSDLNSLLKETLNIQDAPMMSAAAMMAAPAAQEAEPEPQKEEQTEFTIKLTKFDDGSKIKLIKEIKALLPEMNLVQAKKFVESVPQVIKEKLSKEDSEKIKKQIEAVGGSVEIE